MAANSGHQVLTGGLSVESPSPDVTVLFLELTRGEAASKLMPLVYNELRRLAGGYMRRERPDHTLKATALVHEAYLKLVKQRTANWQGRSHFLGIAAQLMRRILIDHARGHLREKRGGAQGVLPLDKALGFSPGQSGEWCVWTKRWSVWQSSSRGKARSWNFISLPV